MAIKSSVVGAAFALVVCYACCIRRVDAARILAVQSIPARSHWNFMSGVLRALTDNGHNVTVFTPFSDGDRQNYTEVDTSDLSPLAKEFNVTELREMLKNQYHAINFMFTHSRNICETVHSNRRLRDMLANRLRADFDAIVVQPNVLGRCMTRVIAPPVDMPLIYCVPYPTLPLNNIDVGHVANPAVVSPLMADHVVPSTFAQRFTNTLMLLYTTVVLACRERLLSVIDPKPFDAGTDVPPSLVFVNRHFISDALPSNPPNVVDVGGIHLKPHKEIPKDILEFIEESPHGIILFSLGSIAELSSIPNNIEIAIKEALGELPQRVIIKYKGEMKNKPKNVIIKKWIPQRDILMHPNVKLFISHGGISGLYETVDAGVPILGFPLFVDQHRNVENLIKSGMAIAMDLFSITKDEFLKNLKELINNEKYARNAKVASEIFHDRPMSPQKSVAYWTEYVIRHKGAPHLKSHAINLTWYQYLLLDVIAVVLVFLFTVIFVIYYIIKIVRKYSLQYLRCHKMKSN